MHYYKEKTPVLKSIYNNINNNYEEQNDPTCHGVANTHIKNFK